MVKFYVAGGLNLQAGPQFGFLSSATGDVINTVNGSISSTTSSADLKTFVKSSDVSLAVGAGWDLPFGLNLTARYNIGLSDINQKTGGIIPSVGNSTISSLGTSEAKSQVVQISVGYRFIRLGK
jgi:opacity protein-like surface antigen